MQSPSMTELSACLLELHERAQELDFRDMQRFAFARVQATLPFDAGLIAQGTFARGVPVAYDVMLHGCTDALMQSWERVKDDDFMAALATANPGITHNVATEGPLLDPVPRLRAHCRAHGIAHTLCTGLTSETTGLFWVMSLYRERDVPYSEHERLCTEALTPHVFAAIRKARLGQLRRSAQLSPVHGQLAAIVTLDGVVLEAEPGFGELVAVEFRGWRGPILPEALRCAKGSPPSTLRLERLVASVAPAEDVALVHLRRPLPADALTAREREIAQAFSIGETHRGISERLGIAPNTVRRHLANIYEKLGISSKVELDRMISGVS